MNILASARHSFPANGNRSGRPCDCEVHLVASFLESAVWLPGQHQPNTTPPRSTFGQGRLPQGQRVRVVVADDSKPLVAWFQPLRYHALHESIVPAESRSVSPCALQARVEDATHVTVSA